MTRDATKAELDTILNATTSEELYAATEKVVEATGYRMPTVVEVINGFVAMFQAAGMDENERSLMTVLAGKYTRAYMDRNDANASVPDAGYDGTVEGSSRANVPLADFK